MGMHVFFILNWFSLTETKPMDQDAVCHGLGYKEVTVTVSDNIQMAHRMLNHWLVATLRGHDC